MTYEPVAVSAAILAVLNVIALVFKLDGALVAALNAAVGPVVALFVRTKTSSNKALNELAAATPPPDA